MEADNIKGVDGHAVVATDEAQVVKADSEQRPIVSQEEQAKQFNMAVQSWWNSLQPDLRYNIYIFFNHFEKQLYCSHVWGNLPSNGNYLVCEKCNILKSKISKIK